MGDSLSYLDNYLSQDNFVKSLFVGMNHITITCDRVKFYIYGCFFF